MEKPNLCSGTLSKLIQIYLLLYPNYWAFFSLLATSSSIVPPKTSQISAKSKLVQFPVLAPLYPQSPIILMLVELLLPLCRAAGCEHNQPVIPAFRTLLLF